MQVQEHAREKCKWLSFSGVTVLSYGTWGWVRELSGENGIYCARPACTLTHPVLAKGVAIGSFGLFLSVVLSFRYAIVGNIQGAPWDDIYNYSCKLTSMYMPLGVMYVLVRCGVEVPACCGDGALPGSTWSESPMRFSRENGVIFSCVLIFHGPPE